MLMRYVDFKSFKNILKHINSLCWQSDISDAEIYKIAKKEFLIMVVNKTQKGMCFRLIGQSGSGKTTQLLPALLDYCKKRNIEPIHFAVRHFSVLHPKYDKLINLYGKSEIRELTNGFALKCLMFCLAFAIQNNFDILMEVTLLTKQFEKYILKILNYNHYNRKYFALSVNKSISDYFIRKRQQGGNNIECGRKVNSDSADFFYKNLFSSLKLLSYLDKHSNIIIWNFFNLLPVYDGTLDKCYNTFLKNSEIKSFRFNDETLLIKSKSEYLK